MSWRPTPAAVERHQELHQAIDDWRDALRRAYNRDTRKLTAYLRLRRWDLDEEQREELLDWIDRIGRKAGRGRKPGREPVWCREATEDDVVRLALGELRRIKQRNGGRTPRGSRRKAILRACQRRADDGDDVNVNMDVALTKLRHMR
jgi:hypothetical protein